MSLIVYVPTDSKSRVDYGRNNQQNNPMERDQLKVLNFSCTISNKLRDISLV